MDASHSPSWGHRGFIWKVLLQPCRWRTVQPPLRAESRQDPRPFWCIQNIHLIASEGRDHLKGNRIELSEEGKEALNQKISQLRKGQEITIKYFTDGYYKDIAGVLDAVDAINKELRPFQVLYKR